MYLDYKEGKEEPVVETPEETSLPSRLCFARSQVATTEAPYSVEEYIELKQVGTNFVGTKRGTQVGPGMSNGYVGTLTGSAKDGLITLIFDYVIEGSEQFEEEIYQMENENLVKLRYPLLESKNTLVPDKTQTPTRVVYTKADCAS